MSSLGRYAWGGLLGGAGAGLLVAAFDLLLMPGADRSTAVALLLGGTLVPLLAAVGAAAGALLAALRLAAAALARRTRGAADLWSAAIIAAATTPLAVVLVQRLASGQQARRVIGALWAKAPLVAAVVLLAGFFAWLALRVGTAAWRSERRAGPALIAIALLLLAAVLYWADARLYRRLYAYLHVALFAGCAAAATLAVVAALWAAGARGRRLSPSAVRRRLLAAALLAGALVPAQLATRRALVSRHGVRFVVLEKSTAAAKLLAVLPVDVAAEAPAFLDAVPRGRRVASATHLVKDANVVLVSIDALRPDRLGIYGHKRPLSPNIDLLARRAIVFTNAYCQVPLTCYSIPSLLTGDYLRSTLDLLPRPPPTLADMLAAKGYATAAFFNKSIFFCDDRRATSYGDRHFGFEYAETQLRDAAELTDRVLAAIDRHRAAGKGKLFLWVHYFDVHEPYRRHKAHDFGVRDIDRYDSEIAHVDRAVARLIAALPRLPGPSIFVLTADHGEEFREHGGTYHGSSLYDEQVKVPLIIAVPGLEPRRSEDPAQLVDVVPTVLSLLGLRVPESVRGRSLVPQLLGQSDPGRAAFSEVHTKKMARLGRWKLIHDFRRSTYQLYDLRRDPRERVNLVGRRPRALGRLKATLRHWFDQMRRIGSGGEDRPRAIDLGRLGDRRAVHALARLIADVGVAPRWRREGARLLGELHDPRAADALWQAAADDDPPLAGEAAIALGELKDKRARSLLPRTLSSSVVDLRHRAAIAAARVDSRAAVPMLIETLLSDNWELQHRAAHYLGFLGGEEAIGPLIAAGRWRHLRARVAVALGRVGRRHADRRIERFLLRLLHRERNLDVRQRAAAALALAGARDALPALARLLERDPDVSWLPEVLTRLGGVGRVVAGVDLRPGARQLAADWFACRRRESGSIERFVGSTYCWMRGPAARVPIARARRPRGRQALLLRLRAGAPALLGKELQVTVNGRPAGRIKLRKGWSRRRLVTPAASWKRGRNVVRLAVRSPPRLPAGARWVALDYALVMRALATRRAKRRKR